MKKIAIGLCCVLVICLLAGCGGSHIELNEEHEAHIEKILQNMDEWDDYSDFVGTYPANRLHIAVFDSDDGIITLLTVAYVQPTGPNSEGFIAHGYIATDELFFRTDSVHKDWISDCIKIDLEAMSQDDLRDALRELYIAYLEKK